MVKYHSEDRMSKVASTPRAAVVWAVLILAFLYVYRVPVQTSTPLPASVLRVSTQVQARSEQYQQWLQSFAAADASYQDYCEKVLHSSARFADKGAQYSQDVFLFHNFYHDWPSMGKKGFYVESGANDPLSLSTSLFFDKCLGWNGLCIEPQPQYHQAIKEKRSCTLVTECISAKQQTLKMSVAGTISEINSNGTMEVKCAPLADILLRYTKGAQHHIDLWVLDVEGHEMQVLQGTDFNETQVHTMLIEDFWLQPAPRMLDIVMGQNGFVKFHELNIDSVFVRPEVVVARHGVPVWYPPTFETDIQDTRKWAKGAGVKTKLKKAWGFE